MVEEAASTSYTEIEADSAVSNGRKRRASSPNTEEEKKKVKTKSLYRQPTVGEIARLNETEILYNCNLFRLQIEEILQEVKLNERTRKKIDSWYILFENYLNNISMSDTEYDLSEDTLFKELNVKSPVPKFLSKTVCMFKFIKFTEVRIIGSYALGCPIESKLVVDIEIRVPAEVYTKNDSVNYKYHKKRGAYLACIAAHLNKCDSIQELRYAWLNGVLYYPYLEGKPAGKLGNYVSFRIHLTCEEQAYKLLRLAPNRNNIRSSWLYEARAESTEPGPPTPFYNCTMLRDLNFQENYKYLQNVFADQENLKSAVVLIKIWLRQRQLKVSGFFVHMLVAYLVQLKRINNMMSSYQIIRNVWVAVESSKWDTEGITMYKYIDAPLISEFLQAFSVVFIDVTGYFNVAYDMSKGTYQALKIESSLAVNMLDNKTSVNSFLPLFMKSVQDLEQFDHIVRFKDTKKFIDNVFDSATVHKQLSYGIDKLYLAIDTLYSTLLQGLGERVFLILEKVDADYRCPINAKLDKSRKERMFSEKISFGFKLNPDFALNFIEKGPSANHQDAEKFRKFWAEKSDMRRFHDGSIIEACVWDAESYAEKRMITKQIVHWILDNKFGIKPEETFYVGDQFDSVLTRRQLVPADGIIGTGEELSFKVVEAFNELRTCLRGLNDLPLEISAVEGVSPVLSYTDPFPLIGQKKMNNPWQRGNASLIKEVVKDGAIVCPEYTPVYEAVLKMTSSGKWPSTLESFRCLKTAFYFNISDRVAKQYSLLAHAYKTHVDIMKNGVVFRFRIAHTKEFTLLRRYIEAGVVKHKDTEESNTYFRDMIFMPQLRGALHSLHLKHSAYGPTACLAKRFLSAHMIDDHHFPEITVELLVAYLFVHPEPYSVPVQPLCGFMRLLRLMAETDWTNDMLVIDFNNDLEPDVKAGIERRFTSTPPSERPPLYLVTSHDAQLHTAHAARSSHRATDEVLPWCRSRSPPARVVSRVTALAARARDSLCAHLHNLYTDNVLGTFISPAEQAFDVIIMLRPDCVPYVNERVSIEPAPKREVLDEEPWKVIPVVDFHPTRTYLSELRSAYGEFAVFFYDTYGGDTIGVLWKPDIDETRDFQVATANATMPIIVAEKKNGTKHNETNSNFKGKYTINKAAIIEDFKLLGEGLIKEVRVLERIKK